MNTRRRTFIAGVAAGIPLLSGCLSSAEQIANRENVGEYQITDYDVATRQKQDTDFLSFYSEVSKKTISPKCSGKISCKVENISNKTVFISSSSDPPFGMLFAVPRLLATLPIKRIADSQSFPLWQQQYNTNQSGVEILDHGREIYAETLEIPVRLSPHESIEQEFQFRYDTANLDPGSYVVNVNLNYKLSNNNLDTETMPFGPIDDTLMDQITFRLNGPG